MSALAALRDLTEATSDSEVVRNALLHYEQLVDDAAQNNDVYIRDREGKYAKVPVRSEEFAFEEASLPVVKRNLVLPIAAASRLDELRRHTGAKSDSEVIREAVILYDRLVASAVAGKDIVVRDVEGNEYFKTIAIPKSKRPAPTIASRLAKAFDLANG